MWNVPYSLQVQIMEDTTYSSNPREHTARMGKVKMQEGQEDAHGQQTQSEGSNDQGLDTP